MYRDEVIFFFINGFIYAKGKGEIYNVNVGYNYAFRESIENM